jgi:hypothetical protein
MSLPGPMLLFERVQLPAYDLEEHPALRGLAGPVEKLRRVPAPSFLVGVASAPLSLEGTAAAPATGAICWGTEGSNPSPSRKESAKNHAR